MSRANEIDRLALSIADGPRIFGGVSHIDQYFGLWCVEPVRFRAAVERLNGLNLTAHIEAHQQDAPALNDSVRDAPVSADGVAVVELSGPLMKYVSSLSNGTSTVQARRQIRQAAENEDVRAIVLRIDSPGGTVAGTSDLVREIREAGMRKPIYAYIEDLGASAAYWAASATHKIFANTTALVGSIGTYGVLYDFSAQAAMLGVKVYVINAGEFKGMGIEGTEITNEQLIEAQRIVDELNAFFIAGVAEGRRMTVEQVKELADGRVHLAGPAVDMNLIDGIATFDEVLGRVSQSSAPKKGNKIMSETETNQTMSETETNQTSKPADQTATFEDLKICLPGADSDFICRQLERKATLDQARDSWMEEQNRHVEEAQAKVETARQEALKAAARPAKPGVDPKEESADGSEMGGDPQEEWDEAVNTKIAAGMSPARACSAVNRENPGLRERMIEAANADR